ncbi:PaaX family transcriptional regulator C-terminal domain-containing protein [Herbiconiux sp. 11R-BC]|uniref:PaaX family transcriptional regulator n=1 Tax=Herbiconiux sp. 11R-BC TaxID=3111637 RepID=UPI003BFD96B9
MKPRSVVFTLFGDYLRYCGSGEARLSSLTELLGLFGIEPGTARVVMTRLRKEGWFDTRRAGREVSYVLSRRGWDLLDEGRERIFRHPHTDWNGEWSMVLVKFPESRRADREGTRKDLAWLGYGQLTPSTWMSPHDRLEPARRILADRPVQSLDLLHCRSLGPEDDRSIAARCWNLDDLQQEYTSFVERFGEIPALTGTDALVARVRLTDEYRHFPFRDPDLPQELLPADWIGQRAHYVFRDAHLRLAAESEAEVERITGLPVMLDPVAAELFSS